MRPSEKCRVPTAAPSVDSSGPAVWGHKPNLELSVSQAYSPSLGVGGRVGKTATPRLPNSALLRMSLGGLGRTTSGQLSKEKAPATFCWASWLGAGPQGTVTSDPAAPGLRLPGDQSSLHPPCHARGPSRRRPHSGLCFTAGVHSLCPCSGARSLSSAFQSFAGHAAGTGQLLSPRGCAPAPASRPHTTPWQPLC